jgi:hypothetical protein
VGNSSSLGLLPRSGYTEQPRVLTLGKVVGKTCPESGTRYWARSWITREPLKIRLGRHFQGGSRTTSNPGLKSRAILYSRFAAKSDMSRRDEIISFSFPSRGSVACSRFV